MTSNIFLDLIKYHCEISKISLTIENNVIIYDNRNIYKEFIDHIEQDIYLHEKYIRSKFIDLEFSIYLLIQNLIDNNKFCNRVYEEYHYIFTSRFSSNIFKKIVRIVNSLDTSETEFLLLFKEFLDINLLDYYITIKPLYVYYLIYLTIYNENINKHYNILTIENIIEVLLKNTERSNDKYYQKLLNLIAKQFIRNSVDLLNSDIKNNDDIKDLDYIKDYIKKLYLNIIGFKNIYNTTLTKEIRLRAKSDNQMLVNITMDYLITYFEVPDIEFSFGMNF